MPAIAVLSSCLFDSEESTDPAPQTGSSTAVVLPVDPAGKEFQLASSGEQWIRFTAAKGSEYLIQVDSRVDTRIQLKATDGSTKLASDDDGGPDGINPMLEWSCPTSGDYYIVVSNNEAGKSGPVWISISTMIDGVAVDRYESDGSYSKASAITTDSAIQQRTLTANDTDWVKFVGEPGVRYMMSTNGDPSTYIAILDSTMAVITSNGSSDSVNRVTFNCQRKGTYYARIRGYYSSSSTGVYQLALYVDPATRIPDDSFEPDNFMTYAKTIATDSTIQDRTLRAEDRDWIKFRAIAGKVYLVSSNDAGGLYLELYRKDSVRLTSDSDIGSRDSARIEWLCTSTDDYYIRASGYMTSTYGAYKIAVDTLAKSSLVDEYELDNTPAQAKTIPADSTVQSRTLTINDTDWVAFTADSGKWYRIETYGVTDTYLELFDTDTSYITDDDDDGVSYNAMIDFYCEKKGRYFVATTVADRSGDQSEPYRLAVRPLARAAVVDSLEPNHTLSTAKAIRTDSTPQGHYMNGSIDKDWMTFHADSGTSYLLETKSSLDLWMGVYRADSTYITSDDDNGDGYNPRIAWTCTRTGEYYTQVYTRSSGDFGSYTAMISTIKPDSFELDNSLSSAKPLPLDGRPHQHTLPIGDADWSTFRADSGAWYRFELKTTASSADLWMRLFTGDSLYANQTTEVFYSSASGVINWQSRTTGTYAVAVTHYYSSSQVSSPYTLAASIDSSRIPDSYEPDNAIAAAKSITADSAIQQRAISANDTDWVSFEAEAGKTYVAETHGSTNTYISLLSEGSSSSLTFDDDSGVETNARISWTCTTSGVYYLRVRLSGYATGGGKYGLTLTGK